MKKLLAALAISSMGLASVASAQAVPAAEPANANSLGTTTGLAAGGALLGVILVAAIFANDDDESGTTSSSSTK